MRKHVFFTACTLLSTGVAFAEIEYDYEVGLNFGSANRDFSGATVFTGGVPMPALGSIASSTDTDTISLSGVWYFQGLADSDTARSRAAFLNRASSLSFDYSYSDLSATSQMSGSMFPSSTTTSKGSSDTYSLAVRYVVPDSGWYGLAGVSRHESESVGQVGNSSFFTSVDSTSYNVGLGKYFGENTAIDLTVGRSDLNGADSNFFGMSMQHIGSLGSSWLYGVDAGLSISDESSNDSAYGLGFSLFPNRDLEFGIGVNYQGISGPDRISYEGYASWFIRENIELSGRLMFDDLEDYPGGDSDGDAASVGVSVRF